MAQKPTEQKNAQTKTTFANDGLDTSTAKMLLESIRKSQISQSQQNNTPAKGDKK